jgi:SPP1 gp7 family putative phage head morphogenesis protein
MGKNAYKYVKSQLNNSLRVKKPSDDFVEEFATDFMNFQLLGYLFGISKVQERVELDKKAFAMIQTGKIAPVEAFDLMSFIAFKAEVEIDPEKFVFSETVKRFADGVGLGEKELEKLVKAGAAKAIDVSKLIYYDSITHLNESFKKTAEKGEIMKDWVTRIGDDELMKKIGLHEENPYRLEMIFRTNETSAYSAGRYTEAMRNREIAYFEFIAIDDNRTTEQCAAYNGVTRPKTDSVWTIATPPLHFQCRSSLVEYTKTYIDAVGIERTRKLPDKNIIPVDFRNNPAKNDEWLKSSKTMSKRISDYEKAS